MEAIHQQTIPEAVTKLLKDRGNLTLLEAGCGSFSHVHLEPFTRRVGIDICKEQLDLNTDLHEKILGDLQTYPLPEAQFDVVVCWYVIEHLPNPEQALRNMFKAVKPGGLLVLTFPHLISFKGLVTKYTPHWFHQFAYWFMKFKGRIFPTVFRLSILPKRVIEAAKPYGFSVAYFRITEDELTKAMKRRYWPVRVVFSMATAIVRVATFGKCASLCDDNCELILQKESGTSMEHATGRSEPAFANGS
jgi:SAM-dependent methyltransferase